MAIGTLTMILTNVGLSLFNNWQGSKQNAELQRKKEEFDRAAMENQRERMWKLMREGQELTLQLEKERHQQRLDDLKSDFDNLVKRLAYDVTISHWPLKVLPMVMKNQALGNLLAKQEEGVALHCILTPSNNLPFNRAVLPVVERDLESFCNQHWSTMTTHPILFYSGAWNGVNDPTGTQVESLKSSLSNLPTLVITPYFRPNDGRLIFHINIWGVGASAKDKYENVQVIEPTEFQCDYTFDGKYEEDVELVENAAEDIVPYLECLIGYIADSYFWSAFGHAPQLPALIVNGTINTDGMKYLENDCREYYNKLFLSSENKSKEIPFEEDNLLNLFGGVSALWDEDTRDVILEKIVLQYSNNKTLKNHSDICNALFCDSMLHSDKEHLYSKLQNLKLDIFLDKIEQNRIARLTFQEKIYSCSSVSEMCEKVYLLHNICDRYYFQMITEHICLGCFCDCFGVYQCCIVFVEEPQNVSHKTLELDFKKRTIKSIAPNAILRIGVGTPDDSFICNITSKYIELCQKEKEYGNSFQDILSSYNIHNIKYFDIDELFAWAYKHKMDDSVLIIVRARNNNGKFVVGIISSKFEFTFNNVVIYKYEKMSFRSEETVGLESYIKFKI